MATYRVQRAFSKLDEANDKLTRLQHKYPRAYRNDFLLGKQAEEATEEVFRTGKTDGEKAKAYKKASTKVDAAAAGITGAAVGSAVGAAKKGKKGALIGAALGTVTGAAAGAGIGYGTASLVNKSNAKWSKTKVGKRALDNMKVADGKMTEEEFNQKWKVKSSKKNIVSSQKEFGKVKEANKALKKVWESSGANSVLVGPQTKGQFRKINASGTTLTKHELKRGIGVAIKDGEKHIYLAPSSTTNHSINSKGIEDALGYNKNEHMGLAKKLHNDPERGTNTHIWWK